MNKILTVYLTILFCVCGISRSMSQTLNEAVRLSFEIKDADSHKPLISVACRVFTPEDKFYTYAISDNEGKLAVSIHKNDFLEFSYIGYKKLKIKASSYAVGKTNVIELIEQSVSLREVTIKAPPIRAKKDTLVYHVASFAKLGDTHLEDVLRKLPGIQVAENGTVSYQGKAINKFYIEGKDLLGNSYNQATRNMPVDAVAAVEILENHQPVKMLQSRQFTDNAALNLKLDKGHKSRPFGEIEGGIGGSPTIWNNRLFLTQILGKSQLLINAKMNNTGADLSDETKEHIDITDLDAYEPLMSPLLSTATNQETLSQNRYLNNKSYSAGINYLTSLSTDATLRVNVLTYEDHSSHSNNYEYSYGGVKEVKISEINQMKQQTLTVLPIIKYELNNRKTFLSNELRYSFNRASSSNTIITNGIKLSEKISSKPSYIQNYLTSAFTLGKQIIQAKSLLRYFDRREALNDVSDSIAYYNASERYATQSFVTKNILSTSIPLWGNILELTTQAYYRNNLYDYAGSVRNDKLQFKFLPSYTISFGSGSSLSMDIPVEWSRIKLTSPKINQAERNYFSFSPSIYFKYQLTDQWKLVFSASMNADNTMEDFYSPYLLRTTYRTEYIPNNRVFINQSKRVSARLNYRNLATMFFSNILVSYTDEKREHFANYHYTDSITTLSFIERNNHRRILMLHATADKSFTDAGISLKSELSYNQTSYLLSQSGVQTNNQSNILGVNISAIYQKLKWIRLTMGTVGTLYWERNNLYHSDVLQSFVTHASIYLFPIKGADIKIKYQNYTNEISQSHYKNCGMFDMEVNYKINKTWEIGSSVVNLLNTKYYTVTQNTGINLFHSNLPLRGREVLFRILWRI